MAVFHDPHDTADFTATDSACVHGVKDGVIEVGADAVLVAIFIYYTVYINCVVTETQAPVAVVTDLVL